MTSETIQIQQLLERIAALLRGERRNKLVELGLLPVQFDALCYLGECNRYSDTLMALCEYLGQTKGTVSQTLKVLEKKGLIERQSDAKDKRVVHLKPSEAGLALLAELAQSPLLCALHTEHGFDTRLQGALAELLKQLQQANGGRAFGVCRQCRYNQSPAEGHFQCGLTGEALSEADTRLICREYERID